MHHNSAFFLTKHVLIEYILYAVLLNFQIAIKQNVGYIKRPPPTLPSGYKPLIKKIKGDKGAVERAKQFLITSTAQQTSTVPSSPKSTIRVMGPAGKPPAFIKVGCDLRQYDNPISLLFLQYLNLHIIKICLLLALGWQLLSKCYLHQYISLPFQNFC